MNEATKSEARTPEASRSICPFCRFENAPSATVCADCRAPLGPDGEGAPLSAGVVGASDAFGEKPSASAPTPPIASGEDGALLDATPGADVKPLPPSAPASPERPKETLPPRLVARPPVERTVTDVGYAICPKCAAKNVHDALICAQCSERIPAAGRIDYERPRPHVMGIPGVIAMRLPESTAPEGAPPTFLERVPLEQQHMPTPIARELEEKKVRDAEAAARAATLLPASPEERRSAAITGSLVYGVAAFILLSFVSDWAIETAPLHFVVGAIAAYEVAIWPSALRGTLAYLIASIVSVAAGGLLGSISGGLLMLFGIGTGSYIANVMRQRRELGPSGPSSGGESTHAQRRHRLFQLETARLRAVLAGAIATGLSWAPCGLVAREGTTRGAFVSLAAMCGIFATALALRRAKDEARVDRPAAFARAEMKTMAIVASAFMLTSIGLSPFFTVLGIALTAGSAWLLGRFLPRLAPESLIDPLEEGLNDGPGTV